MWISLGGCSLGGSGSDGSHPSPCAVVAKECRMCHLSGLDLNQCTVHSLGMCGSVWGVVVWGGRVLMDPIPLHVRWWQNNVGCAILVVWI